MSSPIDYETPSSPHDPYAALRVRDYRFFAAGNVMAVIGAQMMTVAVAWELYQRTNSKTALGLVGLVQFLPLLLLSIPAGHIVDRSSRRNVVMLSQLVAFASGVSLGLASYFHSHIPMVAPLRLVNHACDLLATHLGERGHRFDDPYVPLMFCLLLVNGVVRAFNQPARSALLPQIVPPALFPNAVTWTSSLYEACAMTGPAIGGALIAVMQWSPAGEPWAYPLVYLLGAAGQFGQFLSLLPVRVVNAARSKEPMSMRSLSAGIVYVWRTKILLAVLSLDLFAVILGGATALLPVFARDILHVGPIGLGVLRAMPSIGAVAMAMVVAHLPPMRRAGRNLLWSVVGFAIATIVFGVSRNIWLSCAMLLLTGAFDNISVLVRHTLVQVMTPDAMRGRVSAVNNIFIYSSDQLGSFESGLVAAALGAVASVVIGGVGSIIVVGIAAVVWPELRRFGSLQQTPLDVAEANRDVEQAGEPVAS